MKEEYVNKEITRKLIDKGCPVRLVIKADEPIPILYELPKEHPDWQDCKAWYIPTISQVLKWLREEKNIYTEIFLYNGKYSPLIKSSTQMYEDDYFHECLNEDAADEEYDTYEQAALAGIEYILDNLI